MIGETKKQLEKLHADPVANGLPAPTKSENASNFLARSAKAAIERSKRLVEFMKLRLRKK